MMARTPMTRLIVALWVVFLAAAASAIALAQTQPAYTNRLVNEKSPYLQLHAHNPALTGGKLPDDAFYDTPHIP